jgi:hypothetical protein
MLPQGGKLAVPMTMNGVNVRILAHQLLVELVWANVSQWAENAERERTLPNGKIADIYFEEMGYRVIIEVKTQLKQSIVDDVIRKYWSACDFLIIAAPEDQFPKPTVLDALLWETQLDKRIGHLRIGANGVRLTRPPQMLHAKTGMQP